jgi:hypothetical protein
MSQETLKWLRLFVPGVLLFLVLPPLFLETWDVSALAERFASLDLLRDSVVVIVLGALYAVLNLRKPALRSSLLRINDNIKDSMLRSCSGHTDILRAATKLRSGRTLMHVFYKFIDRDPTLQEKAKRVRFNGLIWTSVADIATIGLLGAVTYLIAFGIDDRSHYLGMSLACAMAFLVSYFLLLPLVVRHHIDLSNEQLEFIDQQFRRDLCTELRRIASGL